MGDLAKPTAADHLEARQIIVDVFDAAYRGVEPVPAFAEFTEDDHATLVRNYKLLVAHADHLGTLNRIFTNAIGTGYTPTMQVPAFDVETPPKKPDPLTPEALALQAEIEQRIADGLPPIPGDEAVTP